MKKCIPLEIILVQFDVNKVILTPEQKIEYDKINNQRAEWKGTKYEKIFKTDYLTEKEFYIQELEHKQALIYLEKTLKECEKKGHIEGKNKSITNGRVYCNCTRCKQTYFRNMSIKESKSWYELLHTPINI